MKNKKKDNNYLIIAKIVLVSLLAIIGIYGISKNNIKKERSFNESIYLGMLENRIIDNGEDGILLTSIEDYHKYFDNDKLTEEDFKNYNYVLLQVVKDDCSEEDLKLVDYTINDNNINVNFTYKAKCGLCAPNNIYYLIKADKSINNPVIKSNYKATNKPNCPDDVVYKPIIYIYPEKKMNVKVKLGNSDKVIVSYPKYDNMWDVIAYPDGTLKYKGREYYGLYWEGKENNVKVKQDGFVVKGTDVASFLEEKLSILGLTDREANEFIIYWLPKLEMNKYNYIRFETKEEIDGYMPLIIDPKPESIIRIVMDYKPLDSNIKVDKQELVTPKRIGYTVVEWGGRELS